MKFGTEKTAETLRGIYGAMEPSGKPSLEEKKTTEFKRKQALVKRFMAMLDEELKADIKSGKIILRTSEDMEFAILITEEGTHIVDFPDLVEKMERDGASQGLAIGHDCNSMDSSDLVEETV